MIPKAEWKWYGNVGHFICGRWCRFHLCTEIGPFVISTVGEYVHPRHGKGSEIAEADWLEANPLGEDIGYQRKFETMVFRSSGHCNSSDCNCGMPFIDGCELDMQGYNTRKDATEGHMAMCEKWANERVGEKGDTRDDDGTA